MLKTACSRRTPWDIIIIGGGATGVGCAVDAAARGFAVLLLEQADFGKGTSSRSTKLVHGGVRYLEQGNISLVMEALKERGLLRQNAPHLVRDLAFVVPNYDWWEMPFYGVGLKIYDLLAAKYRFGKSQILSKDETLKKLPTIREDGLRGGVVYYDAQFDDARLLVNLAQTASEHGAVVLNYARVAGVTKEKSGIARGVEFTDAESGQTFFAEAKVIVNATGAFCDEVRKLTDAESAPLVAPSQGAHVVLDRSFLPTDHAIMIPRTDDGRVLFAIPWHGHTLVGTTDTPLSDATLEPKPREEEIDFILRTAEKYLHKPPCRADILSVFAGIRPLVKSGAGQNTSALARDHLIAIDRAGMLTVTGGKWTTYRHMGEDAVNKCITLGDLPDAPCRTEGLRIHGFSKASDQYGDLAVYGADAESILALQKRERLHPDLPYTEAEIVWAARNEMARTVEDAMARRTRALFLNARAAVEMAPKVAAIMARELGENQAWQAEQVAEFREIAQGYLVAGQ